MPSKELKSKAPKKFLLKNVNDLNMCVFIVKRHLEMGVREDVLALGGRVLSAIPAKGVSHSSMFEVVSGNNDPCIVVFATARSEDTEEIIGEISKKYELYKKGNGKAFSIDISGYLGAKALFI
ncbi:MAG: hypothetical protein IJS68_03995 [Clostridia bacterium]|nr:hypothetical protein [Clostridia bacterium]